MSNSGKLSEIVPVNTPFEFEGLDLRPGFRAQDNGAHIYTINIQVTEAMWESVKTIPRHHIIGGILYWTTGDTAMPAPSMERPEPNGKKPKIRRGSHGEMWNKLIRRGFWSFPGVQETLGAEGQKDCLAAMRNQFNTDTLATIDAGEIAAWAATHKLDGLLNLIRQVEINLKG
jgi:hypothetical protein